jgi:hypothetical protein
MFLALMAALGVIAEEVVTDVTKDCEAERIEYFYRGDSLVRAMASVAVGFSLAGVGSGAGNQFGNGLYMSRDAASALPWAIKAKQEGWGGGALLSMTINSKVWRAIMAMGAKDDVPVAGGGGLAPDLRARARWRSAWALRYFEYEEHHCDVLRS